MHGPGCPLWVLGHCVWALIAQSALAFAVLWDADNGVLLVCSPAFTQNQHVTVNHCDMMFLFQALQERDFPDRVQFVFLYM